MPVVPRTEAIGTAEHDEAAENLDVSFEGLKLEAEVVVGLVHGNVGARIQMQRPGDANVGVFALGDVQVRGHVVVMVEQDVNLHPPLVRRYRAQGKSLRQREMSVESSDRSLFLKRNFVGRLLPRISWSRKRSSAHQTVRDTKCLAIVAPVQVDTKTWSPAGEHPSNVVADRVRTCPFCQAR